MSPYLGPVEVWQLALLGAQMMALTVKDTGVGGLGFLLEWLQ